MSEKMFSEEQLEQLRLYGKRDQTRSDHLGLKLRQLLHRLAARRRPRCSAAAL
ncbi:hypothetical protein AB0L53_57855 [Nonomuraea sp. NPDC052129]|uniref:hypothetical protein n=1 Tax=Nonomuraea sp. NPDC052129 TaxID=3154651 RepID=UPI00344A565F